MITIGDLIEYQLDVDILLECDLTSDAWGEFIEDNESYSNYWGGKSIKELRAEREKQLAAKETGDGAVQGVTVLALAIPALAATLILYRRLNRDVIRKRKI